jgi:hypothetical protein
MVIVKITLSKITPLNFRDCPCFTSDFGPVFSHYVSDIRVGNILFTPEGPVRVRSNQYKNPTFGPPKNTPNLSPILTLLEGFYLYLFIVGIKSDLFSHLVVFLWTGCTGSSFWGKSGEKWESVGIDPRPK